MAKDTACFTYEREVINLKTGKTRWEAISPVPKGACPSCCDKKDKLLSRQVVERQDCTTPFADENGRTWKKRTELTYADGDCGTYKKYQFDLPCSDPMKQVLLNRVSFFGQCQATVRFENTKGGVYEFNASQLTQTISLPFGTLKVQVIASTSCGGDVKLNYLNTNNQPGSQIHISGQTAATIVVNDLTYGFYVDNL